MDKPDEYRAHAEQCQRMADTAHREDEKQQWLRLAEHWLALIRTNGHPDESR
jgi:hypothetical protein